MVAIVRAFRKPTASIETRAMVDEIIADNPRLVPIPIEISRDGLRVW
jgi:hypothetical protein